MQVELVGNVDPLTADVRKQIQNVVLELLAENEIKCQEDDPDHTGVPFVLVEEVQARLDAQDVEMAVIYDVARALREDPCFYSRCFYGVHLYYLKLA
jgi:hypothetical protein